MLRRIMSYSRLSSLHTANEQLWQRTSPVSDVNRYDSGIDFDGNLPALLSDFYRLEYIYSALKKRPFSGNEKRRDNILAQVDDVFSDVAGELKDLLLAVFEDWLSKHALTNPRQWAEGRVTEVSDASLSDIWSNLVSEYMRYSPRFNGGGAYYNPSVHRNASNQMLQDALNIPEVKERVFDLFAGGKEAFIEDRVNMTMDDWQSDPESITEQLGLNAEASEEEVREAVEAAEQDVDISEYLYEDMETTLQNAPFPEEAEQFLISVAEHVIFPMWFEHWAAQGIEQTRENVQTAHDGLHNASTLEELFAAISIALNAVHQTGAMLDYVAEAANESSRDLKNLLDDLTAGDFTKEIDPILQESGVQI